MAAQILCSIPGCGKPHHARGWCNLHYMRVQRHGDPRTDTAPSRQTHVKHGMTGSRTYKGYYAMLTRCLNPKALYYHLYGGRGITVCDRWREGFENFLADMGPCPDGLSMDRIDPDGNYEPGNCRWAKPTEQARNRRRSIRVEFRGESLPLADWCERLGLKYHAIQLRLWRGWSVEDALTTPLAGAG